MALVYESSDVYIEERDLSQEASPIQTSIGALVGAFSRGPVGPRRITSKERSIFKYGEPNPSVSYAQHSALAFLETASELFINRVVASDATYGGTALQKKSGDTYPLFRGFTIANPENIDFASLATATVVTDNICAFYCEGPGSYSGNLSVKIVSDNLLAPTGVTAVDFTTAGVVIAGFPTTGGTLGAATYDYKVTAKNAVGESIGSTTASVVISGASKSVYLTWTLVEGATSYLIYGRATGGSFGYMATVGGGTAFFVDYGSITPVAATQPPVTAVTTDEFEVQVFDSEQSSSTPVEKHKVSLNRKVNAAQQQMEIEYVINSFSDYIRVKSNAAAHTTLPKIYTTSKATLSAGSSGSAVTGSNITAGYAEFADEEKYDIRILINAGVGVASVQQAMDALCQSRKDCFAILDVPSAYQTAQLAADYRTIQLGLNSSYSALYTPDLYVQDDYNGQAIYLPPSGYVAARFAYTDSTTFPWFAPAGATRGNISQAIGQRYDYDKGERDLLFRNQVNYIRKFARLGRNVWEQRTLQGSLSALSFINVRRLNIFLSVTVRDFLRSREFEPNNDLFRQSIKLSLERLLLVVQNNQGINEFVVVVDSRNNPAFITAQGQLNVDVFYIPTLPAEKIRVRLNVTQQGVSLEEIVASGSLGN